MRDVEEPTKENKTKQMNVTTHNATPLMPQNVGTSKPPSMANH